MKLTILGCSPSVPNPGGASSGYLVEDGSMRILVDCGHGVSGVLQQVLDLHELGSIVISHMHPDHFFDLVPLRYAFHFGEIAPIPLLLPPGGGAVLARLQAAVGLSEEFFSSSFELAEYEPQKTLHLGEISIDFAPTRHFVEGYAMRFRSQASQGRFLTYSSDTGWSEQVLDLARGAALALVEATLVGTPSDYELEGHLTPALAGRLGREAGVERLLLTHYWWSDRERVRAEAMDACGGHVELAEERRSYTV